MKLATCRPAFKIGDEIHSRTLTENGDWLNENLSQETIFLATTLEGHVRDFIIIEGPGACFSKVPVT